MGRLLVLPCGGVGVGVLSELGGRFRRGPWQEHRPESGGCGGGTQSGRQGRAQPAAPPRWGLTRATPRCRAGVKEALGCSRRQAQAEEGVLNPAPRQSSLLPARLRPCRDRDGQVPAVNKEPGAACAVGGPHPAKVFVAVTVLGRQAARRGLGGHCGAPDLPRPLPSARQGDPPSPHAPLLPAPCVGAGAPLQQLPLHLGTPLPSLRGLGPAPRGPPPAAAHLQAWGAGRRPALQMGERSASCPGLHRRLPGPRRGGAFGEEG